MARSSGLTPRIERLLNDSGFEQSFETKRRLPFVAAAIVALAMIASTATVKVRAAAPDPAVAAQLSAEIENDAAKITVHGASAPEAVLAMTNG